MTANNTDQPELAVSTRSPAGRRVRSRTPARSHGESWPATLTDREVLLQTLKDAPLIPGRRPGGRRTGCQLLLDWLEDQPGETWQDRWLASGTDTAGRECRDIPLAWLHRRGVEASWHHEEFFHVLRLTIAADVIRPSPAMLVTANFRRGAPPSETVSSSGTAVHDA